MVKNIDKVLGMLYKRVSAQNVIEQNIRFENFSKEEFLNLATSYVDWRSENEMVNMYEYLISICEQDAVLEGRKIIRGSLNVFELLFYVSGRYIDITNNEIRCRYQHLPMWRKLTVELSEDLLVTAFLARKMTHDSVIKRGFTWPRIIGHDNEHLHAVMKRGISENHSHLLGAAPIFHISWLSLMNNVGGGSFMSAFQRVDMKRRYTNVQYSGKYSEKNFYHRYLQAALIRLLLFSRLTGKRFRIGEYQIPMKRIINDIRIPEVGNASEEVQIIQDDHIQNMCQHIENRTRWTVLEMIEGLLKECNVKEISQSPLILFLRRSKLAEIYLDSVRISNALKRWERQSLNNVVRNLLALIDAVDLEAVEGLFDDRENYVSLWQELTLQNVYNCICSPYRIEMMLDELQCTIDVMRVNSQRSDIRYGGMDYALWALRQNQTMEENHNIIFAGERYLMYQMFEEIHLHRRKMNPLYLNLFYAYLLIKESIRSEMIQSNANVGFANFKYYQNRKADFLAGDMYNSAFIREAVHDNLLSDNMRHLEVRFSPSDTAEGNFHLIQQMDQMLDISKTDKPIVKERLFYTLHFLKKEERIHSFGDYFYCRHYQQRNHIMKAAGAIAAVRERYPVIGERTFGNDAASGEIGCRPEVFAPAFRYLKNHRYSVKTMEGIKKLPQLRATYHVGEDFLDVADGLRAIDEAINFLNLSYGDRLGHALALGIDVKRWYEKKNYVIILPQQDYLDNLVWVYHKLVEYGITGYEALKNWIFSEAIVLYETLYKNLRSVTYVDLDNYYNAWKLRGDDPSLYETGEFDKRRMEYHREPYLLNEQFPQQYDLRQLSEVTGLYYAYHFNGRTRRLGRITKEHEVSKSYVNAIAEIQYAMQFDLASKGIAIETNPSSNYHIGTFRKYEDHPVVRFYNKGLVQDTEMFPKCAQIPVSINTDDQGIFNTSLENEYALMASALEAVTDDSGRKIYRPADIYEWLNNIRIMGNDQNFAEIHNGNYAGQMRED